MLRKFAIGLLAVLTSSCGSGGGSSTAPTPTIAQVAGVWRVTARATNITTSECVGATLAANGFIGTTSNSTAQITQSGANLTVIATDVATGAVTNYTGSAGASTIALNFQSCTLCVIQRLQCSNGSLRDLTPQADAVTATVSGSSFSGTEAQTYYVTVSGSWVAAGVLVVNASVSGTKQ
jgi:hypothetical protein